MREADDSTELSVVRIVQGGERSGYVQIVLSDGRYLDPVPVDALYDAGVRVGMIWRSEDCTRLQDAVETRMARDAALRYIAMAARTEAEVLRYLVNRRQCDKGVAHHVVAWMREQGYLDDAGLAVRLSEQAATRGRDSRRQAQQRILRRGVAQDVVRDAVHDVAYDEVPAARDWAIGKLQDIVRKQERNVSRAADVPATRVLRHADWRMQIGGYLARKGFSVETIQTVLRELADRLEND